MHHTLVQTPVGQPENHLLRSQNVYLQLQNIIKIIFLLLFVQQYKCNETITVIRNATYNLQYFSIVGIFSFSVFDCISKIKRFVQKWSAML